MTSFRLCVDYIGNNIYIYVYLLCYQYETALEMFHVINVLSLLLNSKKIFLQLGSTNVPGLSAA